MLSKGVWIFAAAATLLVAEPAEACRVLDIDFTPTAGLQIVIWLEDSNGRFVDTLFITDATGRYGLGNRPGIMEFNSEFKWPYGRRESVFPIWAHRRGVTYPKVIFQDTLDRDLSHPFTLSSPESFYCRPLLHNEPTRDRSIDTGTCATTAFTDKGRFDRPMQAGDPDAGHSLYPPRRDLIFKERVDHEDVKTFAMVNDLDTISRATPPGRANYHHSYSVPGTLPEGAYVVYMEVSKEFDANDSYRYPSPVLQSYGDYGSAYRGQPSVLWRVPVTIDNAARTAVATDYMGYGDPDGLDGRVRDADTTIATTVEGSGAQRLLLTAGESGMYRLRVTSSPSDGGAPPEAPKQMSATLTASDTAEIAFVEPGDTATGGAVQGYDVRVSVGQPLTEENFLTVGRLQPVVLVPAGPGQIQTISLSGLQPQSRYWIGIRAHDGCLIGGKPAIVELETPRAVFPEVSACFVATAAFGSPMESEVAVLRTFRDRILRRQIVGEMLVETYYTFGPALAGVIRPSDTLRALTRAVLEPVVAKASALVK